MSRICALMICGMLWVAITLGPQASAALPQPAAPAVFVKMIDLVDSSRDPAGKQYRAALIRSVNLGNGVLILQGSAATVALARNGSGWAVQLSSVVIKDQVTTVASNPGTVIGAAAQANTINAANAANAALGAFGRKPGTYSPDAVVAMGQRVILTPGIALSFVLNGVPVVPKASLTPAPVAVSAAAQGVPAQGRWFYCYNTVPMPPNSMSKQFVSSVFQSDGDLNSISVAWDMHIARKYAPVNQKDLLNPNTFHPMHCAAGSQIGLQQMYDRAVKGGVTTVDWKYVPGQEFQPVQLPKSAATAAQSSPAQAQQQPGAGMWWYCQCGLITPKRVEYLSSPFRTDGGLDDAISLDSKVNVAWNAFMYHYLTSNRMPKAVVDNRATHCMLGSNDRSQTQGIRDHLKAGISSPDAEVLDIDWKYVPGQDAPVPRAPACRGCRTKPP